MCPRRYFVLYSRNEFPHPIYHMLCIVMFTRNAIWYRISGHGNIKHMTYAMKENNPKGQDKVKHRTHRITDPIPSGHGNTKNMAHPMDESNPKGQDKVKHRTHTIPDRYVSYFLFYLVNWGMRPPIRCAICFRLSCPSK
jgi:hypothetical protein